MEFTKPAPWRLAAATLLASLGLATPPAWADWLLSSTDPKLISGKPFVVRIFSDELGAGATMPEALEGRLQSGEREVAVHLVAAGPARAGGQLRDYEAEWPEDLIGAATLDLPGRSSSRLLLVADRVPWTPREDPVARMAGAPYGTQETPRASALSFNEPMYFLVGANGGANARFQLSFKYRLFDRENAIVRTVPLVGGLYFAYTQTSLWDLADSSAPFRDTSYRPSLFYQWEVSPENPGAVRGDVRLGLEHESNGRDQDKSRSINIAFARMDLRVPTSSTGDYFGVIPKVWGDLEKSDNEKIGHYRGYGQIALRYGNEAGLVGELMLRRGDRGRGATQFDLSYPLGTRILSDVGAFLHLQYYDGYGETLLDYDKVRHPQLRIGFSIVR